MEGEVRIGCINWLVQNGVKREANFNVGDDLDPVSAHTACCRVTQHILDSFEACAFILYRTPSALGKCPIL